MDPMRTKNLLHRDWNFFDLKGKVRTLSETSYLAIEENGEILKGKMGADIFEECGQLLVFDNSGLLLVHNLYNSYGNLDQRQTYKYDRNGNQIEINKYNSQGKYQGKTNFKYDNKGKWIEVNAYNAKGILIFNSDIGGYEIVENDNKSDVSIESLYNYKYDDNGNIIEENIVNPDDDSIKGKITYRFDNMDNMTESNSYKLDGNLERNKTFNYYYDKTGNWIKQIKFEDGIPKFIIEIEIVYF